MHTLGRSSVVLFAAVCGCNVAVDMSVTLGSGGHAAPVHVDTRCQNGGCGAADQLEVHVSVQSDDIPNPAVEILQYRVDYDLPDVLELVPYYASATSVDVSAEAPATFNVRAAGERQREWIVSGGYDRIDGTGTLTLAGYDQDDKVRTAEASFDIVFGDFGGTP
jgi:hypothetical protein